MFLPTNITLKFGDSGDFVSELQRRLSVVNCFNEAGINGSFDGMTVNGVSQFQSMSGIQADGIAGPETLRRLNGALSGDYSSSDHQADAEAKLREEQAAQALLQQQRHHAYLEEQALIAQRQQERAYEIQMQQQTVQTTPAVPAQPYASPQAIALEQSQPPLQVHAAPQAHPTLHHQQPTAAASPTAGDMLAQMLLSTQQPAAASQIPQHAQSLQTPPLQAAQPYQPQVAAAQAYVPVVATAAAVATAVQQNTPAPEAHAAPQQTATPEQPRGVVGRAVQYANQVVQKLAGYFEEKLPSHVINEVKEIGQTMAKAGMKEVSIPTGPEQQRGSDAPGKSQSQGKQLG